MFLHPSTALSSCVPSWFVFAGSTTVQNAVEEGGWIVCLFACLLSCSLEEQGTAMLPEFTNGAFKPVGWISSFHSFPLFSSTESQNGQEITFRIKSTRLRLVIPALSSAAWTNWPNSGLVCLIGSQLTLSSVRRLLERDLGLANLFLEQHKAVIKSLVDKVSIMHSYSFLGQIRKSFWVLVLHEVCIINV